MTSTGPQAEAGRMPREIRREEVRRLIDQGVQLVEVLPANEYREDRLPGGVILMEQVK